MWKILLLCVLACFTLAHCKTTPPKNSLTTGSPLDSEDDNPDAECSNDRKKKKPCPDRQAICQGGYCICKDGFSANSNGKCIKVPTLGERCDADKNNILYCGGVGVSPVCPEAGGKCECQKGYEPKGKACQFKDQNLNEKCDGDEDCGVAYSSCQGGKCTCISGFTVEKGLCKPAYKCPSGDALKDGANVKACEKKITTSDEAGGSAPTSTDNCPAATHFCFSNPLVRSATGDEVGYCCPKVTSGGAPTCPGGDVVKVDTCSSDAEIVDDSSAPSGNFCPALTHTCLDVANATVCCPVPCPGQPSFFAFEGRCYETVAPGSPCKFELQCGRSATCDASSKTCTCKPNFSLVEGLCERQSDNS